MPVWDDDDDGAEGSAEPPLDALRHPPGPCLRQLVMRRLWQLSYVVQLRYRPSPIFS